MAVVPTPRSDSTEIGKNMDSEVVTRLIIWSEQYADAAKEIVKDNLATAQMTTSTQDW